MKVVVLIVLATAALFVAPRAHAQTQTLRCGNSVVSAGDTKATVLRKCGEPTLKDSFCKAADAPHVVNAPAGATIVNVLPCEQVDDWTYEPGRGALPSTLRFREGELRSITSGDRAI